MFYILSVFIGVLIAVMVFVNGDLTVAYGMYSAAMLIHIVGCAFALLCLVVRRQKLGLRGAHLPLWMYLGGAVGYFTTAFNNFAYGKISVTGIVALSLLGQAVTSLVIDSAGLFGMPRTRFRASSLAGLILAGAGIAVMLAGAQLNAALSVAAAFTTGVTIVVSRVINASLSERIGGMPGSFINHLVGLPVTVAAVLLFGRSEPLFTGVSFPPPLWAFTGGLLGVTTVYLCNRVVPRVSSFRFTLLGFVGQIAAGLAIDVLSGQPSSRAMVIGTAIIALGLAANMLLDRRRKGTGEGERAA